MQFRRDAHSGTVLQVRHGAVAIDRDARAAVVDNRLKREREEELEEMPLQSVLEEELEGPVLRMEEEMRDDFKDLLANLPAVTPPASRALIRKAKHDVCLLLKRLRAALRDVRLAVPIPTPRRTTKRSECMCAPRRTTVWTLRMNTATGEQEVCVRCCAIS